MSVRLNGVIVQTLEVHIQSSAV